MEQKIFLSRKIEINKTRDLFQFKRQFDFVVVGGVAK
jgi:hypothetical protein